MAQRLARPQRPSSDRILGAAEKVFAKHGYGETSLRQVMAAARVSTTAFYARFDSKEAVLVALVDRLLGGMQAQAAHALSEVKSPAEGVERGVDVLLAGISGHRRVVSLAMTETGSSQAVRTTMARAYRGLATLIASTLGGSREEREALAWAFVGALQIQVQRWAVFEEIDDAALGDALRVVARTLVPAVARRRGA